MPMGVFGEEIPSSDLRKSDIPRLDPALPEAWMTFTRFAFTYDGYTHHGDICGSIANGARGAYDEDGTLPASIDEIRACLFFEQRRWRHFAVDPDPETWSYIGRLLERLSALLPEGESVDDLKARIRTYGSTVLLFERTGLRIDLRKDPQPDWSSRLAGESLAGPFAVLTACNPYGRTWTDQENSAATGKLLQAVRDMATPVPLKGCSADLAHREASFAIELEEPRATALARRFRQDAYFWYDGRRFWLVPIDERIGRIPLPLGDGPD